MKKNIFRLTLCTTFFVLSSFALAQPAKKIPRIGYLTTAFPSEVAGRVDALREGLRQKTHKKEKCTRRNGETD